MGRQPSIQLIPLREAIRCDSSTTLDLIVRVIPPSLDRENNHPMTQLNLGLVIDRSISMRGQKMNYAREAACYAIDQLSPSDRISVITYNDQVEVLVPNIAAKHKTEIIKAIQRIEPQGNTALHAGWLEGSIQVSQNLKSDYLNRVILLSDGLANIGITDPELIALNVNELAKQGVSTTTIGLGNDYNEDLMEMMAKDGDGNYYYIQSPEQLPNIFAVELQGLMATVGQKVSLSVEPHGNVLLTDVFNHLEKNQEGAYKLPNLVIGNKIDIALRLKVPPRESDEKLCSFQLLWDDLETNQQEQLQFFLQLPVVSSDKFGQYPVNEEVCKRIAQLVVAQAKEDIVRTLDMGEVNKAKERLCDLQNQIIASPSSFDFEAELKNLVSLQKSLESGDLKQTRKIATYQIYRCRQTLITDMPLKCSKPSSSVGSGLPLAYLHCLEMPDNKCRVSKVFLQIGRNIDNDLVIDKPWISRKHAAIICRENTVDYDSRYIYFIKDFSRNGTFIKRGNDWEKLHHAEIPLKSGYQIRFGKTVDETFEFFVEHSSNQVEDVKQLIFQT